MLHSFGLRIFKFVEAEIIRGRIHVFGSLLSHFAPTKMTSGLTKILMPLFRMHLILAFHYVFDLCEIFIGHFVEAWALDCALQPNFLAGVEEARGWTSCLVR